MTDIVLPLKKKFRKPKTDQETKSKEKKKSEKRKCMREKKNKLVMLTQITKGR